MASIAPRDGLLGYDNAAHLLRRATFVPKKSLITAFANKSAQQAVADLLAFNFTLSTPLNASGLTFIPTVPNLDVQSTENNYYEGAYHICKARSAENLQYRLFQFLEKIYITSTETTFFPPWCHNDNLDTLLYHAKGSLKELAIRITKDPQMLAYLGNAGSNKTAPNQNYAREFLELFTITKGPLIAPGNYTNYTELDVQQAARVLTGVTYYGKDVLAPRERCNVFDPVTQIPSGLMQVDMHDIGNKTFSSAFGNQIIVGRNTAAGMEDELRDFVDMVFNQLATAKSYARRLYRFFVRREISDTIETDIISPLATTLMQNNYRLDVVMTQLLCSKHFYDEDDATIGDGIIGAMVKSPLELFLHFCNHFEVAVPAYSTSRVADEFYKWILDRMRDNLGYPMFVALSVNGYAAYADTSAPLFDKLWISSSNLYFRYNIIKGLIGASNPFRFTSSSGVSVYLDVVNFVRYSGNFSSQNDATNLVNQMLEITLASTPTGARYTYFQQALLGDLSPTNWFFEWNNYITSGNPAGVSAGLTRLVNAIVTSPEYQVM